MSSSGIADLTVAVFGTGSVGRRHIGNVLALGAKAVACSRQPGRSFLLSDGRAIDATVDRHAAIEQADAVVIATPTDEHMSLAHEAARARKAIFIEKPLSHDATGVAELKSQASDLVVEVGCQLRAHPSLQELKRRVAARLDGAVLAFRACVGQRLDAWRPGTDYRQSYSADGARGGGALFDLVHEVDLARWICGPFSGVFARLSRLGDMDIRADDLANLILESQEGACGSVQLDMLSVVHRRSFEVVCEQANYEWSYAEGTLWRKSASGVQAVQAVGAEFERNDLFRAHMSHFLRRVAGDRLEALCPLDDAIDCLQILLAARRSAVDGHWTSLQ